MEMPRVVGSSYGTASLAPLSLHAAAFRVAADPLHSPDRGRRVRPVGPPPDVDPISLDDDHEDEQQ